MVTSIMTEDQFPLDEPDSVDVETDRNGFFHVLVEWDDLAETPTQAIRRLNEEAMENIAMARDYEEQARKHADGMAWLGEFRIDPPDSNGNRVIRHKQCEMAVAAIGQDGLYSLAVVVERAVGHDCSIHALIEAKLRGRDDVKRIVDAARGLCAGTPAETHTEYLRGVSEVLCEALGIDTDRKDEVAAWLCE